MRGGGGTGVVGLREGVPQRLSLRRELEVWDGVVEVVRDYYPGDLHLEVPPLSGHAIDLHLSGPLRTSQRLDDGKALEGAELPGHFGAVYPAGVPFEVRSVASSEDLTVVLDASFVRRVAEEAGVDPGGFEVLHRFCFRDEWMERLAASFLPELESGGLGGELYAQGLANALAVHLLREHSSLGRGARRKITREPKPRGLSKRALKQATDYIGDNLASGLSLGEMAAAANLSPYHFARLFKESTGLPPHRYVIRERVERAKGLLSGTDLPIGEVARACGFSHHQHLARHFSRSVGTSPTRFRAEASR